MLIYRLEHFSKQNTKEGLGNVNQGPYIGTCIVDVACSPSMEIHPSPDDDPYLGWANDRKRYRKVFGFLSLAQLHTWFYDIVGMASLDEQEMARIGVYEVDAQYVNIGEKQCTAVAEHMALVDTCKCVYKGEGSE